jgi:hypothetical protein
MERKLVKPSSSEGIIRFPGSLNRVLKQDGEEVEWNTFWQRRFIGGDIVIPEEVKNQEFIIPKSKKR